LATVTEKGANLSIGRPAWYQGAELATQQSIILEHVPVMNMKVIYKRYKRIAPAAAVDNQDGQPETMPVRGGTLDLSHLPKYVTPLVIPPVMKNTGKANDYDIAMRQFKQQILPGGIWDELCGTSYKFPATTVFGYGPAADTTPTIAPDGNSQFNYPAYTIETVANTGNTSGNQVAVTWLNQLVVDPDACKASPDSPACNFLGHPLPIDQTLHWANPAQKCIDNNPRTNCRGSSQDPYDGPIPMVTHLHGAHVDAHSDGYPEAWWLPAAANIPPNSAQSGRFYDDAGGGPGDRGLADYVYRNDQPATTLWYHDHSLGMTRQNVYIGPAGFWLIRGGQYDKIWDHQKNAAAVLPGPAPIAGQSVLDLNTPGNTVRNSIREIPIVIQDRSFNTDGSLFYPANRAFFQCRGDGKTVGVPGNNEADLCIPFVPDSDISPIWNPEAFFNTMVVNGVTWPNLEVADARYRFRLLNGCNSRFLNLALKVVSVPDGSEKVKVGKEIPFFQIGAEQGFLRKVVRIATNEATVLPGDGSSPAATPSHDRQALLLAPAERADVIVDFNTLPDGTVVQVINTAPDGPFKGFDSDQENPYHPAHQETTGQVMCFTVNSALRLESDSDTSDPVHMTPEAEGTLRDTQTDITSQVSLNEEGSASVCIANDNDACSPIDPAKLAPILKTGEPDSSGNCTVGTEVFGPKAALLGTVDNLEIRPVGNPLQWSDAGISLPVTLNNEDTLQVRVSENPTVGDTQDWQIYNFTEDAHPIHIHLVRFEVIGREAIPTGPRDCPQQRPPQAHESGFKDTVICYPGEITTVRARFDVAGLYVWHCHILEHEDNEMMRPYIVSPLTPCPKDPAKQ